MILGRLFFSIQGMNTNNQLTFDRYVLLSVIARESYLRKALAKGWIQADFCIKAIRWETNPLAQWFLIKAAGVMRLSHALEYILHICKNTDVEFKTTAGTTSLNLIGAWAIGQIGESCTDSVLSLLNEEQEEVRKFAVDALGQIQDAKPTVLAALGQALEYDKQEIALWAALSLAKLGEPSLPILNRVLSSKDIDRIGYALDAIIKIDGLQSHFIVAQFLQSSDIELHNLYQRLIEQNRNNIVSQS